MKLKEERSIPQGKLDHMRATAFFSDVESGFRFGVESGDARRHDLTASLLDSLHRSG